MKMFTSQGSFNNDIKNLIKYGENDKVKSRIRKMAPSDLIDSRQMSLLHLAAKYNNHDLTKHLIEIKCNVNAKNATKTTPLMYAAATYNFKIAQILIEANADIYVKNLSNKSALQLLLNNKKTPQYLLKYCFKKVISDSFNDEAFVEKLIMANCPLTHIISLRKPNITRMVLNRYGEIDPQQTHAAMDLAFKLHDRENINQLLQFMLEIHISNMEHAIKSLHTICTSRRDGIDLKLIRAIIEKVSDWNSLEKEGRYWLNAIFTDASKEVINLFVDLNINDHVKNKIPGYDLFINLFGNSQEGVKEMLKHLKYDINSHGQNGFTALHFAAKYGMIDDIQILLNLGANPNIRDYERHVPLNFLETCPYDLVYDSEYELEDGNNDDENSWVKLNEDSEERKKFELLLQAGADPQLAISTYHYDRLWHDYFGFANRQMMLAQLAIDESRDALIIEKIQQDINASPKIMNFYKTCCQQLETLKATKIHDSITLYTIMVEDIEKTANSLYNQEILKAILQNNYTEQLNFYYESKLKNSVKKILHIMDLKMKASTFICESTGLATSQYIILEKILSFLTYKDLLVFE